MVREPTREEIQELIKRKFCPHEDSLCIREECYYRWSKSLLGPKVYITILVSNTLGAYLCDESIIVFDTTNPGETQFREIVRWLRGCNGRP